MSTDFSDEEFLSECGIEPDKQLLWDDTVRQMLLLAGEIEAMNYALSLIRISELGSG